MGPLVVFIHGFWESPDVFGGVSELLEREGIATDISHQSPSLGTTSPGNPSMDDDIAAIHRHLEKLVDAGNEILLVLHSVGGILGSNAAQGLLLKDRKAAGRTGGVYKIVFLTAAAFPVGWKHRELPFTKIDGGSLLCIEPEKNLFNDFEPAEAARLVGTMKTQPSSGWDSTVTYAAWQEIPSVYIVCTQDACVPASLQEQLAAAANSQVERVDGGHMAMLSKPAEIACIIQSAVA